MITNAKNAIDSKKYAEVEETDYDGDKEVDEDIDLDEIEKFDAFAELNVSFEGIEPDGTAVIDYLGSDLATDDFYYDNSKGFMNGEAETDSDEKDYILPDSDIKLLSKSDLAKLSKEECKLARNEIYARHGRKFKDEELQKYFDSKSWYEGTINPEDFLDTRLSDIEIKNRDLIVEAENNAESNPDYDSKSEEINIKYDDYYVITSNMYEGDYWYIKNAQIVGNLLVMEGGFNISDNKEDVYDTKNNKVGNITIPIANNVKWRSDDGGGEREPSIYTEKEFWEIINSRNGLGVDFVIKNGKLVEGILCS